MTADRSVSFGAELRRRREHDGMSLKELSGKVHYSTGHLSKIENERKQPTVELARLCDAVLGADGELTALVGEPRKRTADDGDTAGVPGGAILTVSLAPDGSGLLVPAGPPGPQAGMGALAGLALAGRGARLAAGDDIALRHFRASFDQLRAFGQASSPHLTLSMLAVQFRLVHAIAQQAEGELRQELFRLAARYSELSGWMAQEAGDDRLARWFTAEAVVLAELGGDPHLARYALVRRADMAMYRHDAISTIELAERAGADASVPARTRAIAALRQAQGHAMNDDREACERLLDRAGLLFELAAVEEAAGPVLGSTNMADPVAMVRAWCLHELGRPAEAAAALDLPVDGMAPHARRPRAVWGARRALAYAYAGEIGRACELATTALDDAEATASATARQDLTALRAILTWWGSNPSVRELLPRLARALHVPVD
ncbi:MAG TPA: helix-turn-helix transcriptional regulator [Pseudonocardiaceae bacterium]